MSTVGIIAEYNPLHSGHAYHISKSLEQTGADAAVCVMSSQFVQRGEPAMISKQARTRMALLNGIDLVIELPAAFSCASAEYFASAGVRLLDSLGVVDCLCFGSEDGNLDSLSKAADLLVDETPEYKKSLKDSLSKGLSFPQARQEALKACLDGDTFKAASSPNNILGIEYLKALKKLNSAIKPSTVRRQGQGYHGKSLDKAFSSATSIRNHVKAMFSESGPDDNRLRADLIFDIPPGLTYMLSSNMPDSSLAVLESEMRTGRGPVFLDDFEKILFHRLRTATDQELSALPYMEEGLHNRLRHSAMREASIQAIINHCTSNRYPSSRISRILTALLLGMTGPFLDELKENGYAQYIRVLGFNKKGKELLAAARKRASLPILIKPSAYKRFESPLARRLFEHEIRATNVYCLAYKRPELRRGGSELTTPPVII